MALIAASAAISTGVSVGVAAYASTAFTFAGLLGTSAIMASFLTTAALGLAMRALSPKPNLSGINRGYQVNTGGSALDHSVIYGRCRVGGVIVYDEATGSNNKFFHRLIAFAGHEVTSFDEIYINDEIVTLDEDGFVTAPYQYVGLVRINTHLGATDQLADADLVAESDGLWTEEHRLRGIAYLYARFAFDTDAFPSGIPQVTATVKGKKVYDTRTQTSGWSDNPALCIRDYIRNTTFGLGEAAEQMYAASVSEAADVCDEWGTTPIPATKVIKGQYYKIASTGTTDFTLFGAADSNVDTVFTATATGDSESGDGTVYDKKYTCNGSFTTASTPSNLLQDILTSMGGTLWYSQGKWRMKAAVWTEPVLTLDENDLRSNISVSTRHSRRDNFNIVKGVFRGEESNWQVTDYPEIRNDFFISTDNNQESVADIDLPYTDTAFRSRRIARIALERNREQLTVTASFGMRAFQAEIGDNVILNVARFGWENKSFEVINWNFGLTDGLDLQINMILREVSQEVFDENDDGAIYEKNNTNLLSAFEVPAIDLTCTSSTQVSLEKISNLITSVVSSSASERINTVEVQFKLSSDPDSLYESVGSGELSSTGAIFRTLDIPDGEYTFRARARNTFGIYGPWVYFTDITTSGLAEVPPDVEDFTAEVSGDSIYLEWEPVVVGDLSYYKIRHSVEESGATWANATTAVNKLPRPGTSTTVPSRSGTYHIRAYDKSGSSSQNYTSVVVPSQDLPVYNTVQTLADEAPTFNGIRTGCSVIEGNLRITDPSVSPSSATYDFSTYLETTDQVARIVRVQIPAAVYRLDNSGGLWDDISIDKFDNIPGLFEDFTGDAQFSDTNLIFYVSTTADDPAGTPTWSAYRPFKAGDFYGRAFRFRVELKSSADNITPSITSLPATIKYN
jgi:hypothetical protein